jgi:hypothetical protein
VLGFEDLRSYLQARCDAGDSGPRIATELGVGDRQVQAALARSGVRLAPRPQRLAELGFADLAGYLKVRYVEQGWSVKRMRAELQVGRRWLVGELTRLGLRP